MGLIYFLLGVAVLLLSLYAVRAFVSADPQKLSGTIRKVGGGASLVLALVLALRGALIFAVPLAAVGMALLGWSLPGGFGPVGGSKSSGQRSRVRTAMLDMQLDHDTGRMDGEVTAGRFAGKRLSALGLAELIALWSECRQRDTQSARLLEAFLDHQVPDWRQAAGAEHARSDTGNSGRGSDGRMSAEEAYDVLGLSPGASASDVRRAHRDLMKKLHPDRGGSTYLAAKINQAKDILLRAKR